MSSLIQRSFTAGEVAPAIYGRADQVKYQTGLAKCRNFFVRRHGGVSNRPGTLYVDEQKNSNIAGRIWRFVFNAEQTYVLWFENQSLRFSRNGALVTVSGVAAWNVATPYVVGNLVVEAGINYYCILANTGNVPPNATYWYPLTGDIYEIPTPYVSADLSLLKFSQSGDVVTITHPGYDPRDLSRTGHTAWTLATISFTPSINAPGSLTVSGAGGTVSYWVATAIKDGGREESLVSPSAGASAKPSTGSPRTLTIGAVSGAQGYNIYRHDGNGIFGFIGMAGGTSFTDDGITPDYTLPPPTANTPFAGAGNRPSCSGYYQQRKIYGRTNNETEDIFGSRSGSFKNFSISIPLQDSDSVQFTLASDQVNEIRHIVEIGELVILTSGAEWIREGSSTDPLTPYSPDLKPQTYNGSADVAPVKISDNLIYLQARGSILRDFRFDQQTQGYTGKDLTVFSSHLFDGYSITAMGYAQIPHSILAAVRSDGVMDVLTYLREHEIWGWSWFDTNGRFEDVVVVSEGNEDTIYCLVNRTINGQTKRYLERFAARQYSDLTLDAIFTDSTLTYNGWNATATTMTLSTIGGWTVDDTLTLTASTSYFTAGDVGDSIVLRIVTETFTPEDGWATVTTTLTCTIMSYTSGTEVDIQPDRNVPTAFQGVAFTDWGRGSDQVSGLIHLEGSAVSILADGNVVTNGIDAPLTTIVGGQLSSPLGRPAVVIHVGLPYCSELQTLDLEVVGAETLHDKGLQVNQVTLLVEASRGIFAGNDFAHLYEYQQRTPGDEYAMIPGITGKVEISMAAAWNKGGRVCVRQRDPLPLTVLAIIPSVDVGG